MPLFSLFESVFSSNASATLWIHGRIYIVFFFFTQLRALRSEALLRLHKLEEADSTLTSLLKLDTALLSWTAVKLSGMLVESYVNIVRAQVDMALGRYDCLTCNDD
jgi:hypothetical protein